MPQRDRELANTFDDLHRLTALRELAFIRSHALLSAEKAGGFCSETCSAVQIRCATGDQPEVWSSTTPG
jgi:hypothetical protein